MNTPKGRSYLRCDRVVAASIKPNCTKPEHALRRVFAESAITYRVHARCPFGCPDSVMRFRDPAVPAYGALRHCNAEVWKRRQRRDSLTEVFSSNTRWWVATIEGNDALHRQVHRRVEVDRIRARQDAEPDHAAVMERADDARPVRSVAHGCHRSSRRAYAYVYRLAPPAGRAERYIGDVSNCPDRGSVPRAGWTQINSTLRPPSQAGAGAN